MARPVKNNGLVIVKLKRHLRYRRNAYFEPVRPSAIYEALNYLRRKKIFYENISISYGLNSQEILNLPDISAMVRLQKKVQLLKMKVLNQWMIHWMVIRLQDMR